MGILFKVVRSNDFTTDATSTFLLLITIGSNGFLDVEKPFLNSFHLVSFSSMLIALEFSAITWL